MPLKASSVRSMGDPNIGPPGPQSGVAQPQAADPKPDHPGVKTAIEAAARFVRAHGSELDQERLAALLRLREPDPTAVLSAVRDQQGDGGFSAFWSGGRSSLDATCYRLSWLVDLGPTTALAIERALGFIAGRQRSDGSFEEYADVSVGMSTPAPPWARQRDLAARLYLTANCAYWLAWGGQLDPTGPGQVPPGSSTERGAGNRRRPRTAAVRAAAACLATQIGPDGRLPSYLHTHWLAIPVLRIAGFDREADGLLWALAYRLSALGPTALAWLIDTIAAEPIAAEARSRLVDLQESDGRWTSEDGPPQDVATTLAAIRVLRRG